MRLRASSQAQGASRDGRCVCRRGPSSGWSFSGASRHLPASPKAKRYYQWSLGIHLGSIRTITSLSSGPEAEFPSDLESRMWDRLTLHLATSHTVAMAMRRRSLQERGDKGRLESISKPGLGGIWGTASALSVKRPSGDSPQIN